LWLISIPPNTLQILSDRVKEKGLRRKELLTYWDPVSWHHQRFSQSSRTISSSTTSRFSVDSKEPKDDFMYTSCAKNLIATKEPLSCKKRGEGQKRLLRLISKDLKLFFCQTKRQAAAQQQQQPSQEQ
jgi:hypothetical protein